MYSIKLCGHGPAYTVYVGMWVCTCIYSICRYVGMDLYNYAIDVGMSVWTYIKNYTAYIDMWGMDLHIQHMYVCGHGPTYTAYVGMWAWTYLYSIYRYVGTDLPYTAYLGMWAWTYLCSICRYVAMDLPIQYVGMDLYIYSLCRYVGTDLHTSIQYT